MAMVVPEPAIALMGCRYQQTGISQGYPPVIMAMAAGKSTTILNMEICIDSMDGKIIEVNRGFF